MGVSWPYGNAQQTLNMEAQLILKYPLFPESIP